MAVTLWAWPVAGFAYTFEQQQACMGDAFRLCSSEIPDVDRVTGCMVKRQSELSPACRIYFKPEPVAGSLANRATHVRKWRQTHRHADSDG